MHKVALLILIISVVVVITNAEIKNLIDLCSPQYKEDTLWKPYKTGHVIDDKKTTTESNCTCTTNESSPRMMVKIKLTKPGTTKQSDGNDTLSGKRVKRDELGRTIGGISGAGIGATLGVLGGGGIGSLALGGAGGAAGYMAGESVGDWLGNVFGRRKRRSINVDRHVICDMINAAIVYSDKDGNNALSLDELETWGNTSSKDDGLNAYLFEQKDLNKLLQPNEISGCPWLDSETHKRRTKRCEDYGGGCDGGCDDGDNGGDDMVIYTQ